MHQKQTNPTKAGTIDIVHPYDRVAFATLKTDDAAALELKLSAATRLFLSLIHI